MVVEGHDLLAVELRGRLMKSLKCQPNLDLASAAWHPLRIQHCWVAVAPFWPAAYPHSVTHGHAKGMTSVTNTSST